VAVPAPGAVAPRPAECAGTSRMPRQVVEILISDWEIECCAPAPVLGATSSWRLEFIARPGPLSREDLWTVSHHDDGQVLLDRAGVEAAWNHHAAPAPSPGIHPLCGHLLGTVHGIVPETLTPVSGRVQRIRIVSEEFTWQPGAEGRALDRVPATTGLRDVRASPRWFHHGPIGPGIVDVGVLIDLALARRS
jgi:hypothetical protein